VALAFMVATPEGFRNALNLGAKLYPGFLADVWSGNILGAVVFGILCILLVKNASKKLEG
jgi:hypothetical protein